MKVKDPIAGYAVNPVVQILRHAVLRKVEKETSPVKLEQMYAFLNSQERSSFISDFQEMKDWASQYLSSSMVEELEAHDMMIGEDFPENEAELEDFEAMVIDAERSGVVSDEDIQKLFSMAK